MEQLHFAHSEPFTIGVELELQLLDPVELSLVRRGPQLLNRVEAKLRSQVKAEFIQSMVEISTKPCRDMCQVADELTFLCRHLEDLAAASGCLLYAASLHPFAPFHERRITPGSRYAEIMEELQLAGRRMITQALHVHIGMADSATAIKVCDAIRPFLPILLALSTSSPFLQGEATGFHSYRTCLFQNLPRTGIPAMLGDWNRFQELILILNQGSLLRGIKELWWDVRPHPDFGTIEVRICDLPSRLDEILALVALIQALCAVLAKQENAMPAHQEIMAHNKWHAARYGLGGIFMNSSPGVHHTFTQVAAELLEHVAPRAVFLGSRSYLDPISRILNEGTSASKQMSLYARHGDFRQMITTMREHFWQ